MDQQVQQNRILKNASYYRSTARDLLRGVYWVSFFAAIIASLFGGATSGEGLSFIKNISDETAEKIFVGLGKTLVDGELFARMSNHILFLLELGFACLGSLLFSILFTSPLRAGFVRYNLDLIDSVHTGAGEMLTKLFGFFKKGSYLRTIRLNVLHALILVAASIPSLLLTGFAELSYVSFATGSSLNFGMTTPLTQTLWVLSFRLLGVIASILPVLLQYRYYFAFHILVDCPEMGALDALRSSATLMKGKKWKLFCLHFSFIGWVILGALTCGVGAFFIIPYTSAADVAFYHDVSGRAKGEETEFPSLDPNDYDPNEATW